MKDLLLVQLLGEPDLPVDALVPLLGELAQLPPKERFPFVGRLSRALTHTDARLRAAALTALAGLKGLPTFHAEIAGLDDAAPEVRSAALEALRASSATQPARFTHALFHPSPAVRRAAIALPLPQGSGEALFFLLADPATGDELRRRLEAPEATEGDSLDRPVASPGALQALLDFVASGTLSRERARTLLLEMSWADATRQLEQGTQRSAAAVDAVLAAVAGEEAPRAAELTGQDVLDALFALIGDEEDDASRAFFSRISASIPHWPAGVVKRAIASLFVVSCRRGAPGAAALRLLAAHYPRALALRWIDAALRRASIDAIFEAGHTLRRLPEHEVRALLDADIARRPSGHLDLRVIAAMLHFLGNHPFHRLLRWFGTEPVIDAFLEDIEGSAPLLALPDDSKLGRRYVVERLLRARPERRGLVLALLALTASSVADALLPTLSAEAASETASALLRLVQKPGKQLGAKRASGIAAMLVSRLDGSVELARAVLASWLDDELAAELPLGLALLGGIGSALDAEAFVAVALGLDEARLPRLLQACGSCPTLPYGKEVALAHALREHEDRGVRAWAEARIPSPGAPARAPRSEIALEVAAIDPQLALAIAVAAPVDLAGLVRPWLDTPTGGLAETLAKRSAGAPDVAVCAALLASFEPAELVDAQFRRFGSQQPAFLSALDAELVRSLGARRQLPLLAHAFQHRWEAHAFAAMRCLLEGPGLVGNLERATALGSAVLRREVWSAAASVMAMWRWRDRPRLAEVASDALGDLLVAQLDGDLGDVAAQALSSLVASRVADALVDRLRPIVAAKLPDLADETRQILAWWIDARGLAGTGLAATVAPRAAKADPTHQRWLDRVRGSCDVEELLVYCEQDDELLVEEAALRLIALGEHALAGLVDLLAQSPPGFRALIETVTLWPLGPNRARLSALPADPSLPSELRFRLALTLFADGDDGQLGAALEAAVVPTRRPWFSPSHWERLVRLGVAERTLALALATAPHPHAYQPAIEALLRIRERGEDVLRALRGFLLVDSERLVDLRRRVVRALRKHGDDLGFPLALEAKLEAGSKHLGPPLLDGASPARVDEAAAAILYAGEGVVAPRDAFTLFDSAEVDADAQASAFARFIHEGGEQLRAAALGALGRSASRTAKLRSIAETFAWGVRVGRTLTGRLFRVQIVTGKGLGYTRLDEDRIFVSPLPLLQGATHGREIVEGLILHELGHHLYHRGEAEAAVWKQAQDQRLPGLLNLVADEHLERNLRGVDASYGDRLKRLSAHAFQHMDRDLAVSELLEGLGARAFEVLHVTKLGVARSPRSVRVDSGRVLFEMERVGLSFIRFFRALRMGLGNRHDDPKVAAGLALFRGGFRKQRMADLLALSHELRAIFGAEARLVEHFGPHEALEDGEAVEVEGEGITQAEIDAEVERVLDPRRGEERAGGGGETGGKSWINVSPDEHFPPITRVVKVLGDPVEHRRRAAEVQRASRQMRRYFEQLGLAFEPQRLRVRGTRFDRSRTLAVVLRSDPRMLIARELRARTDLFLGVLIDCSGSMQTRGNIEKARLFGVMLAESIRDLPGVSLRILGFTDQVIYDAGDARRPAAHALVAEGGNNDAGALFHAAKLALASGRRAKLLVMISDGLPTECSTNALISLVRRLGGRFGICCAQVAVQPLAEVCFPHYVVLEGGDAEASVHHFGRVVAGLVDKAMRGS